MQSIYLVEKRLRSLPIKYILLTPYRGVSKYHLIECPCGYWWKTTLSEIFRGRGCPRCSNHLKLTDSDIDKRLVGRNIYRLSSIKNTSTKVDWGCNTCGNIWTTTPNSILNGRGCSSCAGYGFNTSIDAYLYVIKIYTDSEEFIKVGITNREPTYRYKEIYRGSLASNIEEIISIKDSGNNILQLEKLVHNNIPKYISKNKFNGSTELFNIDKKYQILEVLANGC
jgi:predicted  nucleic acid-binding Zn-ribbon protein